MDPATAHVVLSTVFWVAVGELVIAMAIGDDGAPLAACAAFLGVTAILLSLGMRLAAP